MTKASSDVTRVTIDMDNVFVDLLSHWLRQVELHHGVSATVEDVTEWSMHRIEPYKAANLKSAQIYDYFFDREAFWAEAPVMPGARQFLKDLQPLIDRGFLEANFASTPSGGASAKAKIEWLERVAGKKYADKAYIGGPKGRIITDLLIDDRLRTAEEVLSEQPQAQVLVPVYPYVEADLQRIKTYREAGLTNREFPTCEAEQANLTCRLHLIPDPVRRPGLMWQAAMEIIHRIIRGKIGETRWANIVQDGLVIS